MVRDFTDDDRDKPVVTADGDRIGTIGDVKEGRATVNRDKDASLTDKVKDMLGWGDDESNELRSDHVDRNDDKEVRLRRD